MENQYSDKELLITAKEKFRNLSAEFHLAIIALGEMKRMYVERELQKKEIFIGSKVSIGFSDGTEIGIIEAIKTKTVYFLNEIPQAMIIYRGFTKKGKLRKTPNRFTGEYLDIVTLIVGPNEAPEE